MSITITKTEHADIIRANDANSNSIIAAIPNDFMQKDSPFHTASVDFRNSLSSLSDFGNREKSRYQAGTYIEEVTKFVKTNVAASYRNLVKAGLAEKESFAAARAMLLQPQHVEADIAKEVRARFRNIDPKLRIVGVDKMSLAETSAISAAGRSAWGDMDDAVWEAVEDRHMLRAHIERTGLQAGHQRLPTHEAPLASGPDQNSAERASQAALAAFKSRGENVILLETAIRDLIAVLATELGVTRPQAFSILTGA